MINLLTLTENSSLNISTKSYYTIGDEKFTEYDIKHKKKPVGFIQLIDKDSGVYVSYIEKTNKEYKNFGALADILEVNYCLKKGLNEDIMEITSQSGINSHVQHYKRGKRFFDEKVNEYIKNLIETNPNKKRLNTKSLGLVDMYMPKELIVKCIDFLKKHPIK